MQILALGGKQSSPDGPVDSDAIDIVGNQPLQKSSAVFTSDRHDAAALKPLKT
jgi:hypothetical protein